MDKLNRKAWLLIEVAEQIGEYSIIKGRLFDNTEFRIRVRSSSVEMLPDPIKPGLGWLQVDYHGTTGSRAGISLPSPILDKGYEISVDDKTLRFQ